MRKSAKQMSIFDMMDDSDFTKITDGKTYNKSFIELSKDTRERLSNYKLNDYIFDVEHLGLEKTWDFICQFVIDNNGDLPKFLEIKNFGELYEIGLATQDKNAKKRSGQYYTPDDVAEVMSEWLKDCEGSAVCDVACGTGKLILTYLDLIGFDAARELISSGNLYLYDSDNIALKICRTSLAVKYGLDIADSIHDIFCDFLDRSVSLPSDCKVISNPPYAKIEDIRAYWEHTEIQNDTKEFYSAFMEKVFSQAVSTVIITPFSFISGAKFESLRKKMCSLGGGFVVAFDNVPGNIFCGRKHGVFNTNTANSVRAAITVFRKKSDEKGFRISPLIRFKNEERKPLLRCDVLESILPPDYQIVDDSNPVFKKIDKDLIEFFKAWVSKSEYKVQDLVSKNKSDYFIDMSNTCRYFTVGSAHKLSRTGSITLNVQDPDKFCFLYCIINSSFAYWWWRVFDGGITYPVGLLNDMPVPLNLLNASDKEFFASMAKKLIDEEKNYIVTKTNAGVAQESIKFPEEYRRKINARILAMLGFSVTHDVFESVHANKFFKESQR